MLVEGVWRDQDVRTEDGRFVAVDSQFRNWVTADGSAGPDRRGRLQGRGRPLPPLRLARLPLGAPHADLPQAQGARGHDRASRSSHWHMARARLGPSSDGAGRHRRPDARRATPAPDLCARPTRAIPAASPCRCSGTSSAAPSSTTKSAEIIRMFNSRLRRHRRATPGDYYPAALRAEIDALNALRLRARQQRRLQGRLRHHAGRPMRRRSTALFETLDWLEDRLPSTPLPGRRPAHRGRLAPVHDAGALRRRSMSATSSATCAASSTIRTSGPISRDLYQRARHRRDGRFRPYQAPLLRQPHDDQPDRHRAGRPCARLGRAARPRLGARPSNGE